MTQDELKQAVARAAIEHVPTGGVIGVGTGSTANFFIAELARFLGWQVTVDRARFDELARSRPNAGAPTSQDWDATAAAELEAEVGSLATALGYEHRVERLRAGAGVVCSPPPTLEAVLATLATR